MLQLDKLNDVRDWKALGLPHSAGKVPDSELWSATPESIIRFSREGKEVLFPHEGGKVPVKLVISKVRSVKLGKEPGDPQDSGIVPAEFEQCCGHYRSNLVAAEGF